MESDMKCRIDWRRTYTYTRPCLCFYDEVSTECETWGSVSFSEHRLSLPRVEVYEAVATAMGEIRV